MTRKFKSILAGVLCMACLPAPLSASATITNVQEYDVQFEKLDGSIGYRPVRSFDAEQFSYMTRGYYEGNDPAHGAYFRHGYLQTDVTKANTLVTGVFCDENEDKPTYYTVNSLGWYSGTGAMDMPYSPADWSTMIYADEVADMLDGRELQVGDLLYIGTKNLVILDDAPGGTLRFLPGYYEEGSCEVEYCGRGVDVLGEDFKKVLYYELFKAPEPHFEYTFNIFDNKIHHYVNKGVYDYGNLNNDDVVNLVDVVTLNKHLMVGKPISYYAKGCADVDKNGIVDETDSLNILKSIIVLVDLDELS